MNYVSFGRRKNPVVIFLHGWGGSKESWLRVAKRIAGFGFFCVAVDFPGFGKTPEPSVPYGVPEYGREVEALIEGLSLKNVTIVGHSFGGRVAIWLSAKNDVKYICVGIFAMLFAQIVINIGMCTSITPVIGVTLPFFSAGGTSLLCLFLGMALVHNVYMNRNSRTISIRG